MEVESMKVVAPHQVADRVQSTQLNDDKQQQCSKEDASIHFGLDLDLPHPDTYRPETVDFPSSPSAMMKFRSQDDEDYEDKNERRESVRPGTGDDSQRSKNEGVTDSEDEQSFRAVIDNHSNVRLRKDAESSDSANASDDEMDLDGGNENDEEYFEDFHLPMTHQNSMSTRRSFMRKVKAVPVREPDADRIERIVKSGQLNRHGSIRRKIVPQPQDFAPVHDDLDAEDEDHDSTFPSSQDVSPVKFTSTPNGTLTDFAPSDASLLMLSRRLNPQGDPTLESLPSDLAPLDEETLSKIKDCLDAQKVKDLYTLGSRLTDLLTTAEIEEIISNSHRYGDVISQDVLLALSESRQDSGNGHDSVRSQPRHSSNNPAADAAGSSSPPDLIDSNDFRRTDGTSRSHQHQPNKVKKRISILDDIRTSLEDSDEDVDGDSMPDASLRLAMAAANAQGSTGEEASRYAGAAMGEADETLSKSDPLSVMGSSDDWIPSPDGLNSPDGLDSSSLAERKLLPIDSVVSRMPKPDLIPEMSAQEERDEERHWRNVVISGLERKIDLKVIEPYKKVLSHGGYQADDSSQTAIIVFSACFLPDRSRVDYDYVMEHLFLYVLTTLDQLVAEDYVLIYFHGATPKNCIPRFSWVKNCYQMIDRRLRKNLKRLYLVHPTLWLKGAVLLCRPFISAKFSRKIAYVDNLTSLSSLLPMDHVCIPDRVKQLDFTLMIQDMKRRKGIR